MTALEILSQGLVGKTIKLWKYTDNTGVNQYFVEKQDDVTPIDNVQYLKITEVVELFGHEGNAVITLKGIYGYSPDDLSNGDKIIEFDNSNKLTFV